MKLQIDRWLFYNVSKVWFICSQPAADIAIAQSFSLRVCKKVLQSFKKFNAFFLWNLFKQILARIESSFLWKGSTGGGHGIFFWIALAWQYHVTTALIHKDVLCSKAMRTNWYMFVSLKCRQFLWGINAGGIKAKWRSVENSSYWPIYSEPTVYVPLKTRSQNAQWTLNGIKTELRKDHTYNLHFHFTKWKLVLAN